MTTTGKDKVDTFMSYESRQLRDHKLRDFGAGERAADRDAVAQLHQGHGNLQSEGFEVDRLADDRHLRRDDRPSRHNAASTSHRRCGSVQHRRHTSVQRRRYGSVQRQRPPGARARCLPLMAFLFPAGAHCPAQSDMGARKVAPVSLGGQHLQALQEPSGGGMPLA